MIPLLALLIALDQRIELQFLLLILMTSTLLVRRGLVSKVALQKAFWLLLLATLYLSMNSVATHLSDAGVSASWWAAPARVWLFYVMLVALAALLDAHRFDAEKAFQTLEWLFAVKLTIILIEGYMLLNGGELREKPFFNIIITSDSLLGIRFTSSYDILFALLALSRRRLLIRLALLAGILLLTETRALMFLSMVLLIWQFIRAPSVGVLVGSFVVPLAFILMASTFIGDSRIGDSRSGSEATRLTQIQGSSIDDKVEQIKSLADLLPSPHLLVGRGLGVSMPGLIKDESRPYSYEVQTAVLLWQGGMMFFLVHILILWSYAFRPRIVPVLIVLGLGLLNPSLFSLSTAFFILVFNRVPLTAAYHRTDLQRPVAQCHVI